MRLACIDGIIELINACEHSSNTTKIRLHDVQPNKHLNRFWMKHKDNHIKHMEIIKFNSWRHLWIVLCINLIQMPNAKWYCLCESVYICEIGLILFARIEAIYSLSFELIRINFEFEHRQTARKTKLVSILNGKLLKEIAIQEIYCSNCNQN